MDARLDGARTDGEAAVLVSNAPLPPVPSRGGVLAVTVAAVAVTAAETETVGKQLPREYSQSIQATNLNH